MSNMEKEQTGLEASVTLLTADEISIRSSKRLEVNKSEVNNDLLRYLITGGLAVGFLASGFTLTSFGLSLPTLAENLKQNIEEVSPALIARGLGYSLGSSISGLMEKKFYGVYIMGFNLVGMSCGLIFTPWIVNQISMYFFIGLTAFGMGGCEAIGNVLCLQLWRGKSGQGQVLQFLHFWFCVGCGLTPFVMKPFINEALPTSVQNISNNVTSNPGNESVFRDIKYINGSMIPYISIPYFIYGAIVFLLAVYMVLCAMCCYEKTFSQEDNNVDRDDNKFRYGMLALLFLFYFLYVGFEVSFSTFLYTFNLSTAPAMNYSKNRATNFNSVLYFSIVAGQFFAVFLAKYFKPTGILITDLVGTSFSITLLLFLPYYVDVAYILFWVAVSGYGFFIASIYGTVFLWADRYIVVNGRAACVFILGGSLGEMVLPLPIGNSISSKPMTFLYYNAAYVFATVLLFLVTWKVASLKGERENRLDSNAGSTSGDDIADPEL